MIQEGYEVKEIVEPQSGKVHRIYTFKKKPCRRIVLRSRLCEQLAGYTLIEKDLRSVSIWLTEIEKLQEKWPRSKDARAFKSPDRETFNIVKGLFVAALTFYGKCFSRCEGRPVKLERSQLEKSFHSAHDRYISFRHNFAAHSGAKRLEYVEIALVLPIRDKHSVAPNLYRELFQPDLALPVPGDVTIIELVEHARSIAMRKIDILYQKILKEEVLPKGRDYWLKK